MAFGISAVSQLYYSRLRNARRKLALPRKPLILEFEKKKQEWNEQINETKN